MHIQLYLSFIINTYMFRSPSATIFRMYSINIRSTIEAVYGEILKDLHPSIHPILLLLGAA